jgi:aspartate racemase
MKPADEVQSLRHNIGIITGSGPEAGADLWLKILEANKKRFGPHFRGDLDAPNVTIISDPVLGLSMELEKCHEVVWECLRNNVKDLCQRVDWYAIACNTLNFFEDQLKSIDLKAHLVSFADCAAAFIRHHHINRICLLGARPVMDLGPWSAYRRLPEIVEVEVLPDTAGLHQLIYDIKTHGPLHAGISSRFEEMLAGISSEAVLLACTELPLIAGIRTTKTLIDITDLVAKALVERSFTGGTDTLWES